jgi:hypothetical protein
MFTLASFALTLLAMLNNQPLYDLATFTYALVLFLFITEFSVCKTGRLQEAVLLFVNAGIGLTWMMGARG